MTSIKHLVFAGLRCAVVACLANLTAGVLSGQSLDPHNPAAMKAGANSGTVDNFVGGNYFYFYAGPGKSTITVTYKSMTLFGNAMASNLYVELYPENRAWIQKMTVASLNQSNQQQLVGTLKEETKLILAVLPPSGGLVRTGGDYEVSAVGAVRFDTQAAHAGPIVGVYTPMIVYQNEDQSVKFNANGTLQFASGTEGRWKLFDADTKVYSVTFLANRLSLKLIPGRGLVSTSDESSIVFQRVR